ncbi:MAG: hypothetical protein Q4F65_12550 [Propionibacteriaceae bacterium]|nr:hypothetical protein [Propionibacteriaceae bacterium]
MSAAPSVRYSELLHLISWHAEHAALLAERINPKFRTADSADAERKMGDHFDRITVFVTTLSEAFGVDPNESALGGAS